MKLLKLLIILVISSTVYGNSIKAKITINDIKGNNISKDTMDMVSNRIQDEFIKSKKFTVLERKEMKVLLEESEFQQSNICNEDECLAKIGEVVGVSQIVVGSVGKISDSFYTISLRIIDVSTSKIITAGNYDHKGDFEHLISEGIAMAVSQITSSTISIIHNSLSTIIIKTNPSDAHVIINGKEVGKSPYLKTDVTSGTYNVQIIKDGYSIVNISKDLNGSDTLKLVGNLAKKSSKLSITANEGAIISINKIIVDTTDYSSSTIKPGKIIINVTMGKRYEAITDTIMIKAGDEITKNYALRKIRKIK